MSPSLPATAPQLAETAAALGQWRSTRRRSSRIPEELWSQATELAERYGIAKVAVALKLDYKSLKHRLTARNAAEDARSAPVSRASSNSISACRWRHLCASWFSPTERAARCASNCHKRPAATSPRSRVASGRSSHARAERAPACLGSCRVSGYGVMATGSVLTFQQSSNFAGSSHAIS